MSVNINYMESVYIKVISPHILFMCFQFDFDLFCNRSYEHPFYIIKDLIIRDLEILSGVEFTY